MIDKPQFKAHFGVEVVQDEGVFLVSETGHSVLNGRLFELVAPLIDGRRSADDIVDALQEQVPAAEIYYALAQLEQKGYVGESDNTFLNGEAAFWSAQNIQPRAAADALAGAMVELTALGGVTVEPFIRLLESLHIGVAADGRFGVVLTDDYLRKELRAYNQESLRSGRPWILVKPVGSQIWIGPVLIPGRTACWECLAQRLRLNRRVDMFLKRKQGRDDVLPIPHAATPATQQIAYGMAATEIAKWIVQGEDRPEARILSLDLFTWQIETHAVTRLPQCASCGVAGLVADRPVSPVELESRKKMFTDDGGHRIVLPEETLRKYQRHISPITGAVNNLQRPFQTSDGVLHVYLAGDNFAVPHRSLRHLKTSLRSRSAGKGITDLQARASGLCESLERYSAVFQGTEARRKTTFKQLAGLAIHPNECMLFSERQYRERDAINAKESRFDHVPLRFDESGEIDWTPVWSMTHKTQRYLPTEFCYFFYPSGAAHGQCLPCSNGNAAGNTLEEAILQGFFELVERDSVAFWWYSRVQRPAVDLDSFEEPYLNKLAAFLKEWRRDLWVLDLTGDFGIPVFGAVSRRIDRPQEHIAIGFGAHFDPRIALLRAVTEVNQSLAWLLPADVNSDQLPTVIDDSDLLDWLTTATIANQPYLIPDASVPARTARMYPRLWTDDLRDDVLHCQKLVEQRGMEMLVLDQTRPDIGMPVAKVIVPGLRHFWARFAPGRLYDVPVALGWLARPLTEEQLNPIPMFL